MSLKQITTFIKAHLGAIISIILTALWALVLVYAESWGDQRWERKERTTEIIDKLPARVEKLEMWQADQKAAQAANVIQFNAIVNDLTAIKIKQAEGNALLSELVKSNDRVLRRLDDRRE
jgi:hypothetical protein